MCKYFPLGTHKFRENVQERHFNPDKKSSETFHCSKMLQAQTVACKTILHLHMSAKCYTVWAQY
jgi:hypothetical protein